ncbi:hypothetical protein NU195Hw_Modified_93t1 [Hortaea werneckii]
MDMLKATLGSVEDGRRLMLMFMAHTFGQWSGANAITQYSPTIFGYLGVPSGELRFLTTGVYGLDVAQISVVPDEKAMHSDTEYYEKAGEGGTNRSRV